MKRKKINAEWQDFMVLYFESSDGAHADNDDTANKIEQTYELAKERYAALGVDTDAAMKSLTGIPINLHRWPGMMWAAWKILEENYRHCYVNWQLSRQGPYRSRAALG